MKTIEKLKKLRWINYLATNPLNKLKTSSMEIIDLYEIKTVEIKQMQGAIISGDNGFCMEVDFSKPCEGDDCVEFDVENGVIKIK